MKNPVLIGLHRSGTALLTAGCAACVFSLAAAHGQTIDLKSGLEVYWTFDDKTGEVARDISGKGRDASLYNVAAFQGKSILWAEGKFGGAISFDGTYFLAVSNFFGISGATPRTVSAWIRTDWVVASGANAILGWGMNVAQQRWHFKLENTANGVLRTENQGGNNWGAIPVNDGQWHHVVSVFPVGGQVIGDVNHYVDGVLDSSKSGTVTNPVNTNTDPATAAPLTIGGAPLGVGGELRYVNALLDDVRLYSRALSEAEIAALARGEQVSSGSTPAPKLSITLGANRQITLSWTGAGTLQSAASLGATWSDVPNASNPFTTAAGTITFYRVLAR